MAKMLDMVRAENAAAEKNNAPPVVAQNNTRVVDERAQMDRLAGLLSPANLGHVRDNAKNLNYNDLNATLADVATQLSGAAKQPVVDKYDFDFNPATGGAKFVIRGSM